MGSFEYDASFRIVGRRMLFKLVDRAGREWPVLDLGDDGVPWFR
jgi:hypothetical protein